MNDVKCSKMLKQQQQQKAVDFFYNYHETVTG